MRSIPTRLGVVAFLMLAATTGNGDAADRDAPVAIGHVAATVATAEDARRANDLAQAAYYTKLARSAGDDADKTPWWGPLVVGAVLTLGGSFASLLFTDRVAARKARDDQERLYRRQKLQVGLAARALIEALARFRLDGTRPVADFLSRDYLVAQPKQPSAFDRGAAYYRKYDLVSTVYRLCAFLGWMELYRIDPEFMSGRPDERASFEAAFSRIRTILADEIEAIPSDGADAAPPAANSTGDGVILADDQRAIGERMLTEASDKIPRAVVGYARFAETLFRFPGRHDPQQSPDEGEHPELPQDHWVWNATSFIVGIGDTTGPDRRVWRLRVLVATLRGVLPSLLAVESPKTWGGDRS